MDILAERKNLNPFGILFGFIANAIVFTMMSDVFFDPVSIFSGKKVVQ